MMRGGLGVPPVAPGPGIVARSQLPAGRRVPTAVAREAGPDALLYVVLGAILTDVWRVHDLVPALRVLRPSLALTALGLILLVVGAGKSRRIDRPRSPVVLWYAVLLALMVAGIPFSIEPAESARTFVSNVVSHALVGLLVALSIRSVRDAEFLALGTLAGACIHTLFVMATVPVGPEGRWVLLPFYDVNDLALMLVTMVPITLYFMGRARLTRHRVLAAACFALFAYCIVRTGSRGGFVGFAVVLTYLLARYEAVPARARLIGALAAVLALAVGGRAYMNRLQTIVRPQQDYNWAEETGRLAIWRRGLGYVAARPLIGLGLNQFRTAEARMWPRGRQEREAGRRPPPARGAHNMFLQVAGELGLPALFVFVGLLLAAWRTFTGLRRAGPADGSPGPALSGALAASLLGFCVCGVFLHAALFPILPMLLGLAVAFAQIAPPTIQWRPPRRGGLTGTRDAPRPARGAAV